MTSFKRSYDMNPGLKIAISGSAPYGPGQQSEGRPGAGMATDRDIEEFIGDSFSSVWDLELLSALLERPGHSATAAELVERMRASELVVTRGIEALVAAGMASLDPDGTLSFQPVNEGIAECSRLACNFYLRFPGRVRRLIVARQTPGLNAFADAFRLRKD